MGLRLGVLRQMRLRNKMLYSSMLMPIKPLKMLGIKRLGYSDKGEGLGVLKEHHRQLEAGSSWRVSRRSRQTTRWLETSAARV